MSEETIQRIPKRSEVPEEFKWALEDIYPTDEAWEKDLEKLKAIPEKVTSYKGRLGESAEALYEFMQLSDEISVLCDSLGNYAQRRADEDTANPKYQGYIGQIMNAYVEINSAGSFETPELIGIPEETINSFYEQKPELKLYKRQLDRVRRKKEHILSEAEERIIALTGEMGQSPENIYSMFSDADLKFADAVDKDGKAHQVTHGSYIPLVQSSDRVLRKSAFESMYAAYGSYKNTCAAILNGQIKAVQFYSKARRYNSSLEAALDGNEVPVEVYTNLIQAVHENMHYMYDYVALRKKLLGVDELHFYDIYAPMVEDIDWKISYDEAKDIVVKALAPMGEEYVSHIKEGFNNGWVDVYENTGKRSGAFSWGAYGTHPYVFLNYSDTLNDVFTVIHEMGHAMHTYYSNANQPYIYAGYKIFVAEVASTCNEALLMQYMLKNTDDEKKKRYLLNHFFEQFKGTLYRQTMFAEFEMEAHAKAEHGEVLSAESLCAMYKKLNEKYFGPDMVIDDEIALEWARIPHFYTPFYVYQYATGYSAAIAISTKILAGDEQVIAGYRKFLSGGSSMHPIELLKLCGIDMTRPDVVQEALDVFGELLKQW